MTAESAREFEALEAQAAGIMEVFTAAGYELVAPAIIQPAGLFLDRIGEAIRARTYVFFDPNGEELCLRPDLTVPVCRILLERVAQNGPAKFCYNGPAFRIQTGKPDPLRPREFRQAGIEYFGSHSAEADLEVVALTLDAARRAGLKDFAIKLGHIGVFCKLLASLPIPPRWRGRLSRTFWRPQTFARELHALSAGQAHGSAEAAPRPASLTEQALLDDLDARGVPYIGLRRPSEVVKRLSDRAADANEPPLPRQLVQAIEDYLHIRGDVPSALRAMEAIFRGAGVNLDRKLAKAEMLFQEIQRLAGGAPIHFTADFGRDFEYYTGVVFQLEVEGAGVAGQIAGGGRYDGLIRALSGGAHNVPAVGAAIHTERLLAAAAAQR